MEDIIEEFDAVFAVNVKVSSWVVSVIPRMIERKKGSS